MTLSHKAARFCCAAIFAPLFLLGAAAEAAPETAPISATRTAPVEDTAIQQLSMEFRHPVADGRFQDIAEHYVPWTEARETDFRAMLDAHNLAAENDYGARAETVQNPAYNIVIAYQSGRSLHITSAGSALNEHENAVEDAVLTWVDDAFAAKK